MRRIVHISDLHFGRTDPAVLAGLRGAIEALAPDLLIVSGDLTQRARSHEFAAAKQFLTGLPTPQIVVPGNHDVPLYNPLKRWLAPLANYHRYFGAEIETSYADEEIAVLGLNTARAFALKNGRINRGQVQRVCAFFAPFTGRVLRIVVTHHPFALPETAANQMVVGRAGMAMQRFAECQVDIVLSGHFHLSQAVTSHALYPGSHAALLIQAGTASSSRRRDEANAFNLLIGDGRSLTVERHSWNRLGFARAATQSFVKTDRGWHPAS